MKKTQWKKTKQNKTKQGCVCGQSKPKISLCSFDSSKFEINHSTESTVSPKSHTTTFWQWIWWFLATGHVFSQSTRTPDVPWFSQVYAGYHHAKDITPNASYISECIKFTQRLVSARPLEMRCFLQATRVWTRHNTVEMHRNKHRNPQSQTLGPGITACGRKGEYVG